MLLILLSRCTSSGSDSSSSYGRCMCLLLGHCPELHIAMLSQLALCFYITPVVLRLS
jgi:hypothetical protein